MIDFVRGKVALLLEDCIVVDVGGIGYRVFTPNPFFFQKQMDETVTVYTHHHVREDAISLYGFTTREEQSLFRKLLDVSGIGPKGALAILSGTRPSQLVVAIEQENVGLLTKLPGIGKKTAQRMILDLKGKLDEFESVVPGLDVKPYKTVGGSDQPIYSEAKEALISLGYSSSEAEEAVKAAAREIGEDAGVDLMIKQALKHFAMGR